MCVFYVPCHSPGAGRFDAGLPEFLLHDGNPKRTDLRIVIMWRLVDRTKPDASHLGSRMIAHAASPDLHYCDLIAIIVLPNSLEQVITRQHPGARKVSED